MNAIIRPLPRSADLFRLEGTTPVQFYCVLEHPGLLAGMSYPSWSPDWQTLAARGFTRVVCLSRAGIRYDPWPLGTVAFSLEDLAEGRLPAHPEQEASAVRAAAELVRGEVAARRGVLVHCDGGTGRTGTVIGCALRALGYPAEEVLAHLRHVNVWRGKTSTGWPESSWQEEMVRRGSGDG